MNLSISDLIYIILALPVIFSLISATNLLPKDGLHWLNRITATAVFVVLVQLVLNFDVNSPYRDEYLY